MVSDMWKHQRKTIKEGPFWVFQNPTPPAAPIPEKLLDEALDCWLDPADEFINTIHPQAVFSLPSVEKKTVCAPTWMDGRDEDFDEDIVVVVKGKGSGEKETEEERRRDEKRDNRNRRRRLVISWWRRKENWKEGREEWEENRFATRPTTPPHHPPPPSF